MKNIVLVIILLTAAATVHGQTTSFHRPSVSDDPMRHIELRESLGDGFFRTPEGVLDPEGNLICENVYDNIEPFGPFFAVAKGEQVNLMRRDGTLVFERFQNALMPIENGFGLVEGLPGEGCRTRQALYDEKGRILGGCWFFRVRRMEDGMAYVRYETEEGVEGINFIRPDGTLASPEPLDSDDISDFSEGYAVARRHGEVFFVDKKFRRASPRAYLDAEPFSEGFAAVKTKAGWGFVDTGFHPVGRSGFKSVKPFREGFARVENTGGLFNLLDAKGNLLLPRWHESVSDVQEGFSTVGDGGQYAFVDHRGKYLSESRFDEAWPFEEGYALVKIKDRFNHVNRRGEIVNEDWFDNVKRTDEETRPLHPFEYMAVNGWQVNFLDKDKQLVFEDWYRRILYVQRLLVANLPDRRGYMVFDLQGNPVLPGVQDRVSSDSDYGYLHVKRLDGKENLIDALSPEGELFSDKWFDEVSMFGDGRQCVHVTRNGLHNFMFIDGSFFLDPWSEDARGFLVGENLAHRQSAKVDDGYVVLDDYCREVTDQRFNRVKSGLGDALCVKKGWRWYRMDDDGALKPTFYRQCEKY